MLAYKHLWKENKPYFAFAWILLAAGVTVGFAQAETVSKLAEQMMSQVKQIAESLGKNPSAGSVFWAIFSNNVRSTFFMMILGVFFAVIPVNGLLANGVLLGYLMETMSASGLNPFWIFVVGILPHGLFELPAVVFAAGIGIRYGILVFRTLTSFWRPGKRQLVHDEWRRAIRQFPAAAFLVFGLLLVAAFVESFITPGLIQTFIGTQQLNSFQ